MLFSNKNIKIKYNPFIINYITFKQINVTNKCEDLSVTKRQWRIKKYIYTN